MQNLLKRGAFLVNRCQINVPRFTFANEPLREKERGDENLRSKLKRKKNRSKICLFTIISLSFP